LLVLLSVDVVLCVATLVELVFDVLEVVLRAAASALSRTEADEIAETDKTTPLEVTNVADISTEAEEEFRVL
jgi:hypothetical protein